MNDPAQGYDFLGFGINGFRSFTSDEPALVGPFGKVHLITGQNNSGKSALANIASRILPALDGRGTAGGDLHPFTRRDIPQKSLGESDLLVTLSLCFSQASLALNAKGWLSRDEIVKKDLSKVFSSPLVSRGNKNACWFDFDIPVISTASAQKGLVPNKQFAEKLAKECGTSFNDAALTMTSHANGNPQSDLGFILKQIIPRSSIPEVIKVEAIRHVTDGDEPKGHVISGGEGLVKELRRLNLPPVAEQFASQRRWTRFEQFVRDVLNDPNAEIRTDAEATVVQVKSGTPGFLELSDLGTGIEELVMIAAVVACSDNKLIFIEEPEIHLHPTLQSKLIRYFLNDDHGNRFLITTHSPSIINTPGVTITQVSMTNGVSTASQVKGIAEARDVLEDIGAKPSDLLQSNYVIWVEGPSDRIYVNYWLGETDPELKEGTHYSVAIYGGRLLNSFSAATPEDSDSLISLFRINTHFCVLMDSDRAKKGAKLNATKLRVRKECEDSGNLSWVTDGRTIENYVPAEILSKALGELYPRKQYDWELGDKYICPLDGVFKGFKSKPDKNRIARKVAEIGYELSAELQNHLEKLAKAIRSANGI